MQGAYALRRPRLRRCGPETHYSFFFDLIEKHFPTKWGNNKPMHRMCSLARKMGVTHLTVEELVPNQEIVQEQEGLSRRLRGTVEIRATRITFFRSMSPDRLDVSDEAILGYAVLLKNNLPKRKVLIHVLESVMRVPTLFVEHNDGTTGSFATGNYYAHCIRDFTTIVGTPQDHRALTIRGTFFCQQNGLTHVCAHAALRMAVNSSPALIGLPKLTNGQINTMLSIDHVTRTAEDGLDSQQIQHVVGQLGFGFHAADFRERLREGYAAFIYPMVESRLPVILGIEAPHVQHVVAVLGHTFNSDRWTAEARQGYGCLPMSRYIPSASWADHFIINDDNYGMNITLPAEMVQNFIVPRFNPNLHAAMAIGIVPSGTRVFGYLAEESAARLAFDVLGGTQPTGANRWLLHLKELVASAQLAMEQGRPPLNTIVCRTLLLTREVFVEHLRGVIDSDGNQIQDYEVQFLQGWLPDRFWATEVSLPDLYTANKHKLGDVISIVNPDRSALLARESIVFMWFPGMAMWHHNRWNAAAWSLTGHVPLLRPGDDGVPLLEW